MPGPHATGLVRRQDCATGKKGDMKQAGSLVAVVDEVRELAKARPSRPVFIGFDGRSGSGKSTAAQQVAHTLHAAVVPADDFYSGGSLTQWSQRSARERADLCIDWARLRHEALEPLRSAQAAQWRPFDWDTETGHLPISTVLQPAPFVILDGAFCTRRELRDLLDYTVVITAPEILRRERLQRREGEAYVRDWLPIWDGAENYYFTHVRPPEDFDASIDTSAFGISQSG
jgi:uridine kinase